ncbi:MAG TPA: MFS transporter, partial [Candidatus Dormibacteraeota bacterium]|nr:MFS transporter [Candidatus Dormibacteraeota bacterium]
MRAFAGDRLLAVLALLVFTDTFGYAIVLPLLPLAAQRRGAGAVAVGSLFATYSLCQLLSAPVLGRLSDRFGRKPLLLVSLAGSACGFALILLGGYAALLVSRIVDGATAGNISVINAVVLDRYPRLDWGSRFTVLSSATGVGIVLGVAVSAALARLGIGAAAVTAIALNAVSASILLAWLPETCQVGTKSRPWRFPPLDVRAGVPAAFAATVVQAAFVLTLPLYLNRLAGWREAQATFSIAALIAFAAVVQVLIVGRLLSSIAARKVALIGFGLMAGGGAMLAAASSLFLALAGATVAAAGLAVLSPTVPTLISLRNRSLGEGEVMGVNQSVASAGQMGGPLLGYGSLQLTATSGYGVACAAVAVAGAVLAYSM